MFYTYILFSKTTNKYYCSSTDNIERRISQHNSGYSKSTKGGLQWELKYFEEYSDRSEAVRRENEIKKKKSRKYIEGLISNGERPE
ncbi:MAG: putative endonuclease containing a URI domain [Ignavibacteria bacterium]|nr:MAG: putative endonuclease containing a URI domain [Ignavibacteria bacterium]